ncbi:hypothetical protein IAR55_007113 [Kwoniella newhampshirensis]|uniref:RNase III domain-containing protein n=1 Tax=Kwoniella newhampshirensis TaxID=1651941 RepID=A0AAW0YE36_9TREE
MSESSTHIQRLLRFLTSPTQEKHIEIDNFTWPPLPPITDPALRKAAITHKSAYNVVPVGVAGEFVNYEKSAHVGDALLHLFVTCLLQDMYPSADKHMATDLRAKLVNRHINSAISIHYLLPEQVITGRSVGPALRASIKETGEMFEAHLGGLFYYYVRCDHNPGFNSAQQTPPCWRSSDTDEQDTKEGNVVPGIATRMISHGQAFDGLCKFLGPLFTSLAQALYDPTEINRQKLLELSVEGKSELHTLLSMRRVPIPTCETERVWPDWMMERKGEHGMIWRSRVRVVWQNGQIFEEEGVGQNTKEAGNIAAYLVLQQIKAVMRTSNPRRRW